eukprot:5932246-Lingulodinium_polyedra.AAC.1
MSRAAPRNCDTIAGACLCSGMPVFKHHMAMPLVKRRKEYDDSMLGPHERGCITAATEAPPWPWPP